LPRFFLPFSFQFGIISPEFGSHNSNTPIAWVGFWFISNFVYPNLKESEGPSDSFHRELLRSPSHLTIILSCPSTGALLYVSFPTLNHSCLILHIMYSYFNFVVNAWETSFKFLPTTWKKLYRSAEHLSYWWQHVVTEWQQDDHQTEEVSTFPILFISSPDCRHSAKLGQAMGLAFSLPRTFSFLPNSLKALLENTSSILKYCCMTVLVSTTE